MTIIPCATIIIVALLAFAAFVVWRAPQAFAAFFGNSKHQGALAATILSAIPAAAAFVPALAKFQDVLIALVIGICGAWGVAIHGTPASPPTPPAPATGAGQPAGTAPAPLTAPPAAPRPTA
jgi:hypothetical protein